MARNILISGFIGSQNLGDEAIFKSIITNLGFDKSEITALTLDEQKTQNMGVRTRSARKPFEVIKAIKECDVFLLGGGGIIQDGTSLFNLIYFLLQLYCARFFRKPSILCFVGVGPIRFRLSKFLLRNIASHITLAIVRDQLSKEILISFVRDPPRIVSAHDPALNFLIGKDQELPVSPYETFKPYVVFSVRRWFFVHPFLPVFITRRLNKTKLLRQKYYEFVASLAKDIDLFLEKHRKIKVVFVSFYDSEDVDVIQDLSATIKSRDRIQFAKLGMTEIEYLSIAKQSLFVVGMRLHALILGTVVGKPFVALDYFPKVTEFTRATGLTEYSISVEDYNSSRFQKCLAEMMKQAEIIEPKIIQLIREFNLANQSAFQRLKFTIEEIHRSKNT